MNDVEYFLKKILCKVIGPEPNIIEKNEFKFDSVKIDIKQIDNQDKFKAIFSYRKDGNYYDSFKFRIYHWGHNVISYRDKPLFFLGKNDYQDDVVYCTNCQKGFWY